MEAIRLDKETILLKLKTNRKIPNAAKPTCHVSPSNIPKPVATAFPPCHLSHIGHIWPDKANKPAATCQVSDEKISFEITTTKRPLPTSIRKTINAGSFPT